MTAERPELAVSDAARRDATRRASARLIITAKLACERAIGLTARSRRNQHHYWERSQLRVTDIVEARPAVEHTAQLRRSDPGE